MGEVGLVWDDPSVLRLPVPFERVYQDEDDDCARLAYVLSGSWPLAEQVTRRAFAAVRGDWQRVGRLDEPASRIRREVAQHARPAHGRLAHLGCGHAPATKAEPDPTDGDDFWAVMRDPPRPQAQAGAIYDLESCSTQAVAALLGVPHDIAHAHVEAGRQTLGRQLGLDLEEAQ
jgi:DNA-directed RNA polymerase specialized sigma24 family protein